MLTLLDLTHGIAEGMPVYPGDAPPTLQRVSTVAAQGFAELQVTLRTHTGTHVDAPAHMVEGGATLDQLGPGHFVGLAAVVDASGAPDIGRALLEMQAPNLAGCDFVLFHTGWDRHWGRDAYFEGFPVLTPAAAAWLAGRGLKGAGFDAPSPDPVGSRDFPNHLALFRAGMITIENLTGLGPLAGRRFLFSCLPLKLGAADGSPVRAVAMLEG